MREKENQDVKTTAFASLRPQGLDLLKKELVIVPAIHQSHIITVSNLRRYFKGGDIVFLTNVTYNRRPILVEQVDLLRASLERLALVEKIEIPAWVILPDHFHLIVTAETVDPSALMRSIKLSFSSNLRKRLGVKTGRIWQYRFWDHIIRDQEDLNRHVDYIHYNAVKHGLVQKPLEWPHSSMQRFVDERYYADDWGVREKIVTDGEFGE